MTTASATPQQMRDRLLQAIDSHSNICNMVAVLEVITYLEKYPITKEALEETRLGKLINDVRKKSRDEDLAKRAKKLLRSWQKLIEPGQAETPARGGVAIPPASANGGAHPCRTEAPPPQVSLAGRGVPDGRVRHDVHNTYSPKAEKSSSRRRRGGPRDTTLPAKLPKMAAYDNTPNPSSPLTNGIVRSPEAPLEQETVPSPDRAWTEPHIENDKQSRIPINAVKPHPSSPCSPRLPSTSSLLKTAVQQQAKLDKGGGGAHAGGGGAHAGGGGALPGGGGAYQRVSGASQVRSPRCLSSSPRSGRQETLTKRYSTYAPKGPIASPFQNSPLPFSQPSTSPAQVPCVEGPSPSLAAAPSFTHWSSSSDLNSPHSTTALDPPSVSLSPPSSNNPDGFPLRRPSPPPSESPALSLERKRRKKYRSRDYSVNLGGQNSDDATKPVRLKERRITFDPVTGQIKPMVHKEPLHTDPPTSSPSPEPQLRPERPLQPPPPAPTPSPFQQTNWKELSRNDIIQSYLNLQSSVLTSSGLQSAHSFMSDYLRQEESHVREARKTHVLQVPSSAQEGAPGEGREVTGDHLDRLHSQHWPGVNGCYDTQEVWYDWTQGISLDPHGDDSRLNILPYVCLD